jgi:hypothetical protein
VRQLTERELAHVVNLFDGTVSNRPSDDGFTAQEAMALRSLFVGELALRKQRIPENWREQAIAHALDQGVTQYVTPGVAGGVKAPKPRAADAPKVTITDVDQLLMLDLDIPEE